MQINAYLSFNGNCREALTFYAQALGGQVVSMIPYSDAPPSMPMPPQMSDKIMHGRISAGDSLLMGSDAPPDRYKQPQGMQVNINVSDAAQAEKIYAALSEGGAIVMPLAETFWALRFAMFHDKFGIAWMINCEKPR